VQIGWGITRCMRGRRPTAGKVNLMKPATGTGFRAVGRVIRSGRALTVCTGELHAHHEGKDIVVALTPTTMMTLLDGGEPSDWPRPRT
jgi:acyl-coenzyme A thioesterase PaaI-like protein